jgi:glutathione S-transferase
MMRVAAVAERPVGELVGLGYSPWTEKARWSLRHHGIPFRYREHQILLGDALLELRLRRAGLVDREVTVPVLFAGENARLGSFEILEWAEQNSRTGRRLIPEGRRPEVLHFNLLADTIAEAGRALYMDRLRNSPRLQAAALPSYLPTKPAFIRRALLPLVTAALDSIDDQFQVSRKSPGDYTHQLLQCLVGLRKHREQESEGDFLLGSGFSAADLLVASSLSVVRPRPPRPGVASSLPPELVEAWTHPAFSREFEDLLSWRDRIYEKYRSS